MSKKAKIEFNSNKPKFILDLIETTIVEEIIPKDVEFEDEKPVICDLKGNSLQEKQEKNVEKERENAIQVASSTIKFGSRKKKSKVKETKVTEIPKQEIIEKKDNQKRIKLSFE